MKWYITIAINVLYFWDAGFYTSFILEWYMSSCFLLTRFGSRTLEHPSGFLRGSRTFVSIPDSIFSIPDYDVKLSYICILSLVTSTFYLFRVFFLRTSVKSSYHLKTELCKFKHEQPSVQFLKNSAFKWWDILDTIILI